MYRIVKRIIDFLAALVLLILLAPLLLPIIIILSLTGEREIFYFQKRIGYKQSTFDIWKFATMLKNSPNMGTGSLTLRNDPRVTRIGKILRITKLNELPQIVNVLIGNMSLVGPRPQMQVDFDVYPEHVREKIYDVPPGITGIGSVIFRDEEKLLSETTLPPKEYYAKVIAPYKGELELWYQRNFSLGTDIKIIYLTVLVIFSPETDMPYRIFKDLPQRNF